MNQNVLNINDGKLISCDKNAQGEIIIPDTVNCIKRWAFDPGVTIKFDD